MSLISVTTDPPNLETPLESISADMRSEDFYVRCNFPVPAIDREDWSVEIGGAVSEPAILGLADLGKMPRVEKEVVLECAGNGRALMVPVPEGTRWGLGAVGVATFSGVSLDHLLGLSGLRKDATSLVFTGADEGDVQPEGRINYQFAMDRRLMDTASPVMVTHMNGKPLSAEHGYPARLVVPGQYGMMSVKWLVRIEALAHPFNGHFTNKYRYFGDPVAAEAQSVGEMRIRSLITSHPHGASIEAGNITVSGVAWSGSGVSSVEVDIGEGWTSVSHLEQSGELAGWSLDLRLDPGSHLMAVRATDESGATQPSKPVWNRNGYGNNVVHSIRVDVR